MKLILLFILILRIPQIPGFQEWTPGKDFFPETNYGYLDNILINQSGKTSQGKIKVELGKYYSNQKKSMSRRYYKRVVSCVPEKQEHEVWYNVYDIEHKILYGYARSREASEDFLELNKVVMDSIAFKIIPVDSVSLRYFNKGRLLESRKECRELLNLKNSRDALKEINYCDSLRTINVCLDYPSKFR